MLNSDGTILVRYFALADCVMQMTRSADELTVELSDAYRMRADRKRTICSAIGSACSSRAKCPVSTK
jgi:hypothetical protein